MQPSSKRGIVTISTATSAVSMRTARSTGHCSTRDEIGRCTFDKECTDIIFHVIDRRCEREDPSTTILTSNYGADKWGEFFTGSSTLLCTLDRIFDNATVFLVEGPSFRGAGLRTYAIETATVVAKARPGATQAK